ncbi:MAG: hypothetical protein JW818_19565 [Pirellulales bacterium]|nr:hypothetical protein [Pirellulales bacterium]
MAITPTQFVQATHRLRQCEGYLELGMPQHALDRLADIEALGDLGPLGPVVAMLRGKALWALGHYAAAAEDLEVAAQSIHSPHDRQAWMALSLYHRHQGNIRQAIDELARARGANRSSAQPRSPQ